jgi:putative effector of murein hydrolase
MIAPRIADIWVYLSASPLLWLTITLIAYQGAYWIYARANFHPLLNPVPIAIVALVLALKATGTGYPAYFEGAQFVHFLLGPATVALAVPLYAQFDKLRRLLLPLGGALVAGSVTAPIAMGITEKLGGIPSLTAVLVILTGISGAVMAKYVLDALRIRDFGVRGFAVGVAAHGIGTARAFQVSEEAGAFAGLGMGLNGLLTAVLVPVVVSLIRHF